eukprot:scaffold719_cov226-Pinguiococcus_pyrenoidosus.AAC.8
MRRMSRCGNFASTADRRTCAFLAFPRKGPTGECPASPLPRSQTLGPPPVHFLEASLAQEVRTKRQDFAPRSTKAP